MRKYLTIGVAGALGVAVLSGSAIAGQDMVTDAKNKFPKGSDVRDCDEPMAGVDVGSDTIVFHGADTLWPPNHKYRTVEISAVGDSATEDTRLRTTVASDQPDNDIGDGNTSDDATPSSVESTDADDGETDGTAGPNTHLLRAERAGPIMDGRTYTIVANATFDNGTDQCMETFVVTVPHDMGKRSN